MLKYDNYIQLFEKSSLNQFNFPQYLIKYIQYNYELKPNAEWIDIKNNKQSLKKHLLSSERSFFLEILDNEYIKIIINDQSVKDYLIVQEFTYTNEDFGTYLINEKKYVHKNIVINNINKKSKIYKLNSTEFNTIDKKEKILQKSEKELHEYTLNFKFYLLTDIRKIIISLFNKKINDILSKISDHISKYNKKLSKDEVYDFFSKNEELNSVFKHYDDLKKYYKSIINTNAITKETLLTLDKIIIEFEKAYSEKYGIYLNIKKLIDFFGIDKIKTAFIYYLYTNRLMELNLDKHELYKKYKEKYIK